MPLKFKVESDVFPLAAQTYLADRLHPTYRRFFAKVCVPSHELCKCVELHL